MVGENVELAFHGVSDTELWARPNGAPSLGFHLGHLAGSTNRLLTYARGERLSGEQLAALARETTASDRFPQSPICSWSGVRRSLVRSSSSPRPPKRASCTPGWWDAPSCRPRCSACCFMPRSMRSAPPADRHHRKDSQGQRRTGNHDRVRAAAQDRPIHAGGHRGGPAGLEEGGIPIGAVLVHAGRIIGRGHNRRIQRGSAILHGEMDALERAGRLPARTYRESMLFTTLSPCAMCTGAILLYGIPRVIIGENQTFTGEEDLLRARGVRSRCDRTRPASG